MNIKGIIENYRLRMTATGLLREAGAAQLSPKVAALRPSLTKVNRALTENPDLLRNLTQPSPFQLLFEYTLPKLEPLLMELGEERAEQVIQMLCDHGWVMIQKYGIEGAKEHLENLFKDLPDYEASLRENGGIERMVDAYRRLDFEGKAEKYIRNVLHKKIDQLTVDESGMISVEMKNSIEDSDLQRLTRAKKLQLLGLTYTQVSDSGLRLLRDMIDLQGLDLNHTKVGDAGLAHLKNLINLQYLNLDGTQVTDAGLEHLSGLVDLRMLDLKHTQVGDAGLVHLKNLVSLQDLRLDVTQVNDAGMEHLKGLVNLQKLDLYRTQVSDAGAEELMKAIPGLNITR